MIQPKPAHEWATGAIGAFEGVSNADYHASAGISSTHLKRLAESPAHAKLPTKFSPAAQWTIDLGTLAHGRVLEGKWADQLGFAIKPEGFDARTKAGKEWLAANDGRPCVDEEQVKSTQEIEAAILADKDASGILAANANFGRTVGAFSELSLRAEYDGATLRARFDMFRDGVIWDLKTTSKGVNPDAFGRECEERGYLLQAAHYLHVAKLAGVDAHTFRFVAAETSAPYEVACYDFGPDHHAWEAVNEELFGLYAIHAKCERTGIWPKRKWGAGPVELPAWSKFRAKGGRQ